MTFRIIAFDGGGIRGLVSALLLQNLDPDGKLTGSANMFAGTSTGSFLALALANGVKLRDIVELYQERGAYIFHEAAVDWHCVNPFSFEQQVAYDTVARQGIGDSEETVKAIFQAKYNPDHLRAELETLFGSGTLASTGASGRQVVVNSLRLWDGEEAQWTPVAFGSAKDDPYGPMQLVDAAMCSGAAPTFFPPHQPAGNEGEAWGYFADGGMFANNPSASAVAYAVQHFGQGLADMRVLSFGTGHTRLGIPPAAVGHGECWGGWQWLRPYSQDGGVVPAAPLIEAALSASAAACEQYARQMLGERFVRVNLDLAQPYALDNWRDVQLLEDAVADFVAGPAWGPMVRAVYEHWEADDKAEEDTPPPPVEPPASTAQHDVSHAGGGGEHRAPRSWLSRLVRV